MRSRRAGWSRQWRCCWDAHNGRGDGFKVMAGMVVMLPSTGWEKPQPVPTLLFGAMASYFSDETVLGPNVCKVLPNPCWPCGGLLQCHPQGRVKGARPHGHRGIRASWNVKESEPRAPALSQSPSPRLWKKLLAS